MYGMAVRKYEEAGATTWYFSKGNDSDLRVAVQKNDENSLVKSKVKQSIFDDTPYADSQTIKPKSEITTESVELPRHRKRYHLYVLLLKNNTYYVGLTSRSVKKRLLEHSGLGYYDGAKYTARYGVERLVDAYDLGKINYKAALKKENQLTQKYIRNYGVVNVRGGKWCKPNSFVHFIDYHTRFMGGIKVVYSLIIFVPVFIAYMYMFAIMP